MLNPTGNADSRGFLFTAPLGKRAGEEGFVISKTNLVNIGWGLGLQASGGGGSFVDGIALANDIIKDPTFTTVTARKITTAPADECTAIAGGMGAPSAVGGNIIDFAPSCIAALDALNDYRRSAKLPSITGITPIEAGPFNALLPVYISHTSAGNYALYDCDGAGRAVPSLTNLLFDYEGIRFSPAGLANTHTSIPPKVDTTWADGAQAEAGLRPYIENVYGGAVGLAAWAQTGAQLRAASLNLSTYETAANLGENILECKSSEAALTNYLKTLTDDPQFSNLTWSTQLNEVYIDPDGLKQGYDKGYLVFGRDEIEKGYEYRLYYLNENMFISKHDSTTKKFVKYIATGPSTICCFFSDDKPPAALKAKANDFIPYNTGDLTDVKRLVNRRMIVSVLPPSFLLYLDKVIESFVTVLNQYFKDAPYGFQFKRTDIFPSE